MWHRRAFVLGCVTCLCVAIGCGGEEPGASGNPAGPGRDAGASSASRGTIGVSLMTLENPFFKVIGDNLTAEAKKHGYDTIVLDARDNATTQNAQIEDLIVRKVAAIVLSPVEAKAIVPALQKANAAGIPVITVDVPCFETGVEILTQIATDNFGGGQEAARAMIEVLGERGGKVVILHKSEAESCRERVRGFRDILDAHNQTAANPIAIVAEFESRGAKADGARAAEDALQSHPDLAGIFAINDPAALGAYASLEKAGKTQQVTLIGFDGQPEGKQAIKEGKIYADPIQFPEKMGIQAVESIVRHSKGEDVPKDQPIATYLYRQADAENDPDLK